VLLLDIERIPFEQKFAGVRLPGLPVVTNIESVAYARRHDGVLCHLHISSRAFPLVTIPYIRESDHAWADIDKEGTVTQ